MWINTLHPASATRMPISATAVLFAEDTRLGLPPVFSTSTGTAVGEDFEDAAHRAVLELVERDLVAIWWYNCAVAERILPTAVSDCLPEAFARWLSNRKRLTWHLLMPSDLPAHAVVAISARADGSRPALGAASALNPADAVRSATLEMLQGEVSLGHMRAAQRLPDPPEPPPLLAWSEATNAFQTPYLMGCEPECGLPAPTSYDGLMSHFDEAGIDIFLADLTRPELRVPVVKAISPTLRDWLVRFGPGRLYDVPVKLGLIPAPTPEAQLNPIPFVI